MKIEIVEFSGRWFWVSKESQDASGKEFDTKEEAIIDATKRLKDIYVINKEPFKEKRNYE